MICTIVSDGSELISGAWNEEEQPYFHMKSKLREIIWQLYCNGYNEFYLNCEYGIPLWSAEVICGLKIYNDIKLNVMPYEEQAINWIKEQRDRHFNIHSMSDNVIMVNQQYHSNCYQETDEKMLIDCDSLSVFGNNKNKLYTVKLAEKKGIKIRFYEIPDI